MRGISRRVAPRHSQRSLSVTCRTVCDTADDLSFTVALRKTTAASPEEPGGTATETAAPPTPVQ